MPAEANACVKGWDNGFLIPTATASAKAAYSSSSSTDAVEGGGGYNHTSTTLHSNTQWLGAEAGVKAGSYVGVDAGAHLYSMENESARLKLGFGLSTGAGIQNSSIEFKMLGTGISLGRETGFSFFGNEIRLKLW
jgi:hypothetical protein